MTPLVSKMVKLTPDADRFMWFDVGELGDDLTEFDGSDALASRIPFDRCAVAFYEGGSQGALYCTRKQSGGICVDGIVVMDGDVRSIKQTTINYVDGAGYFGEGGDTEQLRAVLITVVHWLRMIDSKSISACYATTTKQSHINRARARKGKGPLTYTWRTVVVGPLTANAASTSSRNHASPRAHARRGHWRTYPSGKRGWVKECTVGNAANGSVFKDYKVTT